MAVNIGPKIGIDGEAEYRKQIQNIIQETKTLKSEYEKLESSMDGSTRSFRENKELSEKLTERIAAQTKEVDKLKDMVKASADKFGDADPKTLKWKDSLAKAETELNKLKSDLEGMPSQVELLGNKMEAAGNKIKSAGDKITDVGEALAPISAAASTILVGSAKSAIDYESAFTGVKKTVDATEEEYEELSTWIKDASTRLATSKEDIAKVMEISGQLGISGVQNLEKFTDTAVKIGLSTDLSAEEASTALARFMNVTQSSRDDIDKLGSVVVALGNNYATTEPEILEMSQRMAASGTIAGLSAVDILAIATAMSSAGINAEAGGTAMTQTFNTITKAVAGLDNSEAGLEKAQKKVTTSSRALEDAQDNLRKKQLAYDEAVRKYAESDAKAQESAEKKVQTATEQLATAQQNVEKKQLAYNAAVGKYGENSTQAQTALINLQQAQDKVVQKTDALSEAQNKLEKAMQGGTGNEKVQKALIDLEAAQRKVEEKSSDLAGAQLALEGIMDGSGSKLETLAKVAGMSADDFAKAWNENPTEAISAFVAGLGNLEEGSTETIAILDELNLDGVRQSNMLQALSLSSDMLKDSIKMANEEYGENNALQEEFNKRAETTESKLKNAKEKITNVAIEIGERLLPYIEKGLDLIDRIIAKWDELSPETQDAIVKAIAITAAVAPVLIVIGKVVSGIGSIIAVAGSLVTAIGAISAPVLIVAGVIAAVVAAGILLYKNWDKIKETAEKVWTVIKFTFESIKHHVIGVLTDVKDKVTETFDNIKDKILNSPIVQAVSTVWNKAKDKMTESLGSIRKAYDDHGGGLKGAAYATMEGVKQYYKNAFSFLDTLTNGKLSTTINNIKDKFSGMLTSIKDTFGRIKDAIKDAIDFIRDLFSGNIDFPHFNLPHFTIEGGQVPFGIGGKGYPPEISVEWYKKAMNGGMLLDGATIFGAAGGKLLGGGEAGREWIVGENALMSMIRSAVNGGAGMANSNVSIGDTTIVINPTSGQDAYDIAEAVDNVLTQRYSQARAVWG